MSSNPQQVQAIFLAAVEKLPFERAAVLERECGDDPELRRRVEALLRAHDDPGSFLDSPHSGVDATVDSPITEKPGTQIGPYKLLQQIGEGGFGVVYMAEQLQPMRRKVALKIIKPGMDSREVIARFEAERQALALMDHPNIAKVFDGGLTAGGRPYFVMELVKGVPLTRFCDENRVDTQRRLEMFASVCKAIQHAHQKGVIHRDIKPSNVMVTLHDGEPVPKVIDFGVSKAVSLQLTEKTLFTAYGQMIGTPQYMSPEQAEMSGLDVDTRSDVYSLGVLLYELLTSTTPLEIDAMRGKALAELQRMICENDAPPPSLRLGSSAGLAAIAAQRDTEPKRLSALLRGELDWIVLKALEKNRNRRYETANDLAHDVKRYLQREPVLACPPTLTYRLAKTFRRHRGVVLIAASLLLTLSAGFVTTLWQYSRAVDEREAANTARQQALQAKQTAELQSQKLARSVSQLKHAQQAVADALTDRSAALERSEVLRLAAQSSTAIDKDPGLALLLAIESAERRPELAAANNSLLASIDACREIRTFRHDPKAQVNNAIFSPDEQTILGVESTRIRVWNAASGRSICVIDPEYQLQNMQATFSPDNRHIAIITRGSAMSLGPDGRRQGFTDRVVRIWDTQSGLETAVLRGHTDRVAAVRFTRDGARLVSSSWDGTVRVWDTREAKLIRTLGFGTSLATVTLTPDDRMVVAGRESQRISSLVYWEDEPAGSEALPKVIDPPIRGKKSGSVGSSGGQRYGKDEQPYPIAKIWNLETGELIGELDHAGVRSVDRMEVLSRAGQTQLLVESGLRVTLWDMENVQLLAMCEGVSWNLSGAPPRDTLNFQFQGDRKRLQELSAQPEKVAAFLTNSTFSPDGKLAAVKMGHAIALRTTQMPVKSIRLSGHHGDTAVKTTVFSRDGQRLLSAGDNTVRLWDVSAIKSANHRASVVMRERIADPVHVYSAIHSVEFSPDDKLLATASKDKRARLFDASSGELFAELLGNSELDRGTGGRANTTADDANSLASPQQPGKLRERSLGEARLVRFSHDGSQLVVLSDDPRAFIQHEREGQPLTRLPFTPARVWDVSTHAQRWGCPGNWFELRATDSRYHAGSLAWGFKSAAFTADGAFLVTQDDDVDRFALLSEEGGNRQSGRRSGITVVAEPSDEPAAPFFALRCWEAKTGKFVRSLAAEVAGKKCHLSDNGRRGLVPYAGGVRIVDPTSGAEISRLNDEADKTDNPVCFSPDNQWLVVPGSGLNLWNIESGTLARTLRMPRRNQSDSARGKKWPEEEVGARQDQRPLDPRLESHTILPYLTKFTPDSTMLVTASTDGSAHVWSIPSGRHVAGFFGHTGRITCFDISADGKWCVTGSADRTAQVWNLRTGAERMTMPIGSEVTAISFDRQGARIATAAGGVARVWPLDLTPLARSRAPRRLTSFERLRYEVDAQPGNGSTGAKRKTESAPVEPR